MELQRQTELLLDTRLGSWVFRSKWERGVKIFSNIVHLLSIGLGIMALPAQ